MKEVKARVLEIMRMSTEDGPGIRTTVFLKGCTIDCAWCHNPESIDPKPQIQWIGNRCIGCKSCIEVCKQSALAALPSGIEIDRELCIGCGDCVEECPSTALELMGKSWGVEELVAETIKDRAYFSNSGGGITASGGEPTMQAEFVNRYFAGLKAEGIETALDTCGFNNREALEKAVEHADLILFDLKLIDPAEHRRFVGADNAKILENLIWLAGRLAETPEKRLWIRTPLIPDTTANEKNIAGIGEFIAANLDGVIERWELCTFNNLCRDKYSRLGREWAYADCRPLRRATVDRLVRVAGSTGVDPKIIVAGGATRIDEDSDGPGEGRPNLRLIKGCACD